MTLLEAITARHSVRKYLDKEIPAEIIAALQEKIAECNNAGNLNIQLVQNETKAFTGMLSYGSFSGVKNYLVMVGKKAKDLDETNGLLWRTTRSSCPDIGTQHLLGWTLVP